MAEEERVAVGRALDEGAGADEPGAAGAVVDHDLLSERGGELLGRHPRHGIDASAGGVRHNQRDTMGRVVLCRVVLAWELDGGLLRPRWSAGLQEYAGAKTRAGRNNGCDLQPAAHLVLPRIIRRGLLIACDRRSRSAGAAVPPHLSSCPQWTAASHRR